MSMQDDIKNDLKRAAMLRAAESLQGETEARCKRMDHCVEWHSVTWRYGVPEEDKASKAKGRCLCAEHRDYLSKR